MNSQTKRHSRRAKHLWVTTLFLALLTTTIAVPAAAAPPERTRHIHLVDSEIRSAEEDLLHSDGAGTYAGQGGFGWLIDVIDATSEHRDHYRFLPKGNRAIFLSHSALGGTVACGSNWSSYTFFSSIVDPNWFDQLGQEGSSTTGFMYVECTIGHHGQRRIRAFTPAGSDAAGRSLECATATRAGVSSYSFEVGTASFQSLPSQDIPGEVGGQPPSEIRTDGCPVYIYEDTREDHRQNYTESYLGRFSAPMQITAHVTASN